MGTYVALLRGINVGGHRKVSMPTLRKALADAGFADVRTYVNSGNVVLASPASADEVAAAVREVVARTFAMDDVPVLVRTREQLLAVLEWNPFPDAAAAQPHLTMVLHLATTPAESAVEALLAADTGPDRLAIRGLEVVIAYASSSQGRPVEKFLRRLAVDATARNWRTLTALAVLSRDPGA